MRFPGRGLLSRRPGPTFPGLSRSRRGGRAALAAFFGRSVLSQATAVPGRWSVRQGFHDSRQKGAIRSAAPRRKPAAARDGTARERSGETGRSGTEGRWKVEENLSVRLETCHGQSSEARNYAVLYADF